MKTVALVSLLMMLLGTGCLPAISTNFDTARMFAPKALEVQQTVQYMLVFKAEGRVLNGKLHSWLNGLPSYPWMSFGFGLGLSENLNRWPLRPKIGFDMFNLSLGLGFSYILTYVHLLGFMPNKVLAQEFIFTIFAAFHINS